MNKFNLCITSIVIFLSQVIYADDVSRPVKIETIKDSYKKEQLDYIPLNNGIEIKYIPVNFFGKKERPVVLNDKEREEDSNFVEWKEWKSIHIIDSNDNGHTNSEYQDLPNKKFWKKELRKVALKDLKLRDFDLINSEAIVNLSKMTVTLPIYVSIMYMEDSKKNNKKASLLEPFDNIRNDGRSVFGQSRFEVKGTIELKLDQDNKLSSFLLTIEQYSPFDFKHGIDDVEGFGDKSVRFDGGFIYSMTSPLLERFFSDEKQIKELNKIAIKLLEPELL